MMMGKLAYWLFPLVALLACPAAAQPTCTHRDQMVAFLAEKHQERPVAFGARQDGSLLMIFASEAGGWSAVIVTGDRACMVDAGQGWSRPAPAPKGQPS